MLKSVKKNMFKLKAFYILFFLDFHILTISFSFYMSSLFGHTELQGHKLSPFGVRKSHKII